ncbi:MAG: lysophospholipid acyltransferase family protein [Caulobacteraceae bacterium]
MSDRRPSFTQDLTWRLEALAFDILTLAARPWPVSWVSAFGGFALRGLGPLTGAHKVADRNIRLAFPDMTPADRKTLLTAQWDNLGRTFLEFPITDKLTPASGRVEVIGRERLVAIAKSGKPAVLIAGHFANWEIMAAVIVDSGLECRITYRAANNPYFDRRIIARRARYGVKLFAPKGGLGSRELLATLKEGDSVSFMNDQKFNGGIAAPFFGRTVHTAGAPTRMALSFGAQLQPMSVERLPGARFRVTVDDPIVLQKTGDRTRDVEAGVRAINAYIEAGVRARPGQWFWVHKRWPQEAYAELAQAEAG